MIRTADEARRAADGWEQLAGAHATLPMQCPLWSLTFFETLPMSPYVVVCGDLDQPRAVAPLTQRKGRLEMAGMADLAEPNDVLAESDEARDELAEALARSQKVLWLQRLPSDSHFIGALQRAVGRRAIVQQHDTAAHPTLPLTDEWQEPGGGLSSRRRSDLRRARRRGEAIGDIEIELLAPTVDEVPALMKRAYEVEAKSWKGEHGRALAHVPWLSQYYLSYALAAAARGMLRLEFLHIGGTPAAMQINLEWKQRIWTLKIGYDPAFASASPGQLLMAESIADAARRDLVAYQLLGFQEAWTDVWTRTVHPCATLVVYPLTIRSAGLFGREAAGRLTRAASETVRPAIRRLGAKAKTVSSS